MATAVVVGSLVRITGYVSSHCGFDTGSGDAATTTPTTSDPSMTGFCTAVDRTHFIGARITGTDLATAKRDASQVHQLYSAVNAAAPEPVKDDQAKVLDVWATYDIQAQGAQTDNKLKAARQELANHLSDASQQLVSIEVYATQHCVASLASLSVN